MRAIGSDRIFPGEYAVDKSTYDEDKERSDTHFCPFITRISTR